MSSGSTGLGVEVCIVGFQTSTWKHNPTLHSLHQYIDSLLLTCCALSIHFLWSFSFFLVTVICSRKCHSVSLVSSGSVDGQLCTGWGTWEMCFPWGLVLVRAWIFVKLCFCCLGVTRTWSLLCVLLQRSSLLNNFKYHLVPFLHSSKYGVCLPFRAAKVMSHQQYLAYLHNRPSSVLDVTKYEIFLFLAVIIWMGHDVLWAPARQLIHYWITISTL